MWKRNLLFCGLCLVGFASLAASLMPAQRIRDPDSHDPSVYIEPDFRDVVEQVNGQFRESWANASLEPAPRADSLTIARRLSLGLTGTVPSLEEIRALEQIPEQLRIGWWLDRLLEDRRYSDYVAERMARAFVGTEEGPFLIFRRRRFVHWLSDQLHGNRPYDEIATSLISDNGLWTDSPSVNFLTVTQNQETERLDEIRLAARTTRAFLGVRLDCVQCHDDNLGGDWMQSHFHELAAFYSEASQSITGIRDTENDYKYTYLGEEDEQTVQPAAPFAQNLLTPEGTRRQQLARWVTHPENRAFGRTIVNRVWALLFGKPLVEPVDDIPLDCDYPIGMDTLAEDFVRHDCDLRRLIRLIVSSDAFQRDSQADHEVTTQHEEDWAAFPITRLRPEQVAGGLSQASTLKTIDANAHIFVRLARFEEQNQFVQRYGDTGEDEFGSRNGTIPQRLLMLNGDLIKQRTQDDFIRNAATRIAGVAANDQTAVQAAYLCELTRQPGEAELAHFVQQLRGKQGEQRKACLEDIFWTLFNSAEFSWNH